MKSFHLVNSTHKTTRVRAGKGASEGAGGGWTQKYDAALCFI